MHIQRTLPRPEDIVALAADHLPNQLPAVAGLAHDLLDRHSPFRQLQDRRVGLYPAQIALVLNALGRGAATRPVEGRGDGPRFRSSFRDWCGELSTFPREVAEAALAHIIGDATERAYRRSDALEKRRSLMQVWSAPLAVDKIKRPF
jgi:hypothetical protein